MSSKKRPGLMVYFSLRTVLENLSDEDSGKLIKAMLAYGETGTLPPFDGVLQFAWNLVKPQIDEDEKKYAARCEENRERIKKWWELVHSQEGSADTEEPRTEISTKLAQKTAEKIEKNPSGKASEKTAEGRPQGTGISTKGRFTADEIKNSFHIDDRTGEMVFHAEEEWEW